MTAPRSLEDVLADVRALADELDTYAHVGRGFRLAARLRAILAEHPATPAEVTVCPECRNADPDACTRCILDARPELAETDAGGEGLTESETNALVEDLCDLSYRGKQLTLLHANALVRAMEPALRRIVADRERRAEARGAERGWDEGRDAALTWAVRNPDGITLSLDKPNPYRADRMIANVGYVKCRTGEQVWCTHTACRGRVEGK